MNRILLVDDDPDIVKANTKYLTAKGYEVHTADCGEKAISMLKSGSYDCIVLDVLLPDMDGFDLCEAIRSISTAPIIFLSCKDEEDDKITGLMVGGDDYVIKPTSMKELEARIHAQIRRNILKDFYIDRENRIINGFGSSTALSQGEFALFMMLYDNPGSVLSSDFLYTSIFNAEKKPESNTIAVYIKKLREKLSFLNDSIGMIETVYGEGYRFTLRLRRRPLK